MPGSALAAPAPAGPELAGLTEEEALRRRQAGLGNEARIPPSRTYVEILRRNAFTLVNTVLFGVAALLVWLELPIDALVTAGPVVVYVAVGVWQEARAKRTLDQIALLARPRTRLLRGTSEREAELDELVRGDVVLVRAGEDVPLDGEIVHGRVEVDESLLTGESDYVSRGPGDRLLSGSVCGAGQAAYRVDRVGTESLATRLVAEARRYRERPTPLQRDVGRAMAAVAVVVIAASLLVALATTSAGQPPDPTASAQAAAVLVALVPQGLQMMIVLTYTLGALRLANRGAVIQRLGAIEAMSRVDILCLDKTGTLTTAEMELGELVPVADGWSADRLRSAVGAFAASVTVPNRVIEALRRQIPSDPLSVSEEVDFRSDRRWSAVRSSGPKAVTWVLGAPEALLTAASAGAREAVRRPVRRLAGRGERVMLLATAPDGPLRGDDANARLPDGIEPVGLVALNERLRPDVPRILRAFAEASVGLRLLSGDAPDTVGAIAARLGLPAADQPVLGSDLDSLPDEQLVELLSERSVIGRVEPLLKARIVRVLRDAGHSVGMVGDGVNDILALKRADLGIAMGSGAPATRGVSDIVLLREDFGLLPSTVVEGRRIVAGMRATLNVLLARTAYMVLLVLAAALLGLPFPFTPRNNAVLALVTVGVPVVALALWAEPAAAPRRLLRATLRFTAPVAVAVAVLCVPIYLAFLERGVAVAQTALITATVGCGLAILTFLPPGSAPPSAGGIAGISRRVWALIGAMLALYLLALATPLIREFFELTLLPVLDLALIGALVLAWAVGLHLVARSARRGGSAAPGGNPRAAPEGGPRIGLENVDG
jgi:cation-transporting ATPase E